MSAFRNSLSPRTTGSDASRRSTAADSFLTPEERHVYAQLYQAADPENKGVITGSEAVDFFAKSKVPPNVLADIWQTADKENKGFLTPPTFSIAVKLIAAAQNGKNPSAALLNSTAIPLPVFEGVYVEPYRPAGSAAPTGFASEDKATTITPEEREKYSRMFASFNPAGGLLDGEKARGIFIRSKLPVETLGQIWNLADIRKAGSLNQIEFIIAMHYIARSMDGTIKSLPPFLPPAIYTTASGLPAPVSPTAAAASLAPIARHLTGGIPAAISPVIRHNTDTLTGSPAAPLSMQLTGSNAFTSMFGGGGLRSTIGLDAPEWDVTAEDKAKYDKFFDKIDTTRMGIVTKLSNSFKTRIFPRRNWRISGNLPLVVSPPTSPHSIVHENPLLLTRPPTYYPRARDLADLYQRGRLSRDEFAVAMHLISRRLAGEPLPKSLPLSLVPPGERPHAPFPGARTGAIASSPKGRGATRADIGGIAFLEQQRPQVTLSSGYRPTPSLLDEPDLIAINDFDIGTKITNETNEIQGLQLQATTLSAATNDLKTKHSQYEATLAALQAQKKEVVARTAEIRTLYDAESQAVQELETTYAREQPAVNKAREEVAQAEHALQALRSEKEQLELNVEAGRAEAEGLRRRVRIIQEETNALREQLEKLRKDNKQQGQRLDINRKQVSAAEDERDKLTKRVQEAQAGGSVAVPGSPTVANVPKVDDPFEFGSSFSRSPSISGSVDPFQGLSSRSGTPSIKSPAVEREDSNLSFSQQQPFVGTSDFARSISPAGSLAATSITNSANPTASPVQERPSSIGSTKFGDFDSTFSDFSSFSTSGSPAPAARVNSFDSGSWSTGATSPAPVELPKPRVVPAPPPSKHSSDSKRASAAGASSASLNSLASSGGKKPPAPAPQAPQQAGPSSPADPFAVFSKTFEDAKNKTVGGADFDSAFSEAAVSDFAGKFPEIGNFSKDDGFGFEDDFSKGSFSSPTPAASVSASVSTKTEEPVVSRPVEEKLKAEGTPTPASAKSETPGNSITDAESKFPELSAIEDEFASTPVPTLPKEEAAAKPAQEATPAVEATREAFSAGEAASPSDFFATSLSTASAPPKSNFDDFETAFSGTLSDVKVVSVPPSDFDTAFDPNFDIDIDFNPTFEAPVPAVSRSTSSTTSPFASSGTPFTSSPFAPAPTSSSSATLSKPALGRFDFSDFETAAVHIVPSDLDSIFGTQTSTSTAPQAGNRMSFGNAFGFEDSFGATSSTSASSAIVNPFGIASPAVAPASPPPTYMSKPSSPVESASAIPAPVPSAPPAAAPVAPTGADDTEQVKELLDMGFAREKIVNALERYNYDFEKALNFLADNASN
ncbi:hypothetical protein BC937DRAFT_87831 [Endogone sp. FLAS-F59071]|nr:hypothetical protein BC937DRAFT_87831 [Endogone sp. FLAS-F59071]|eukprot:RUS19210.1 hypothetical protein BC937DRAFT_87831 [Endogone sp. FLAS-F59071]